MSLNDLKDQVRTGEQSTVSQETNSMVAILACSKLEDGRQRFSQMEIAKKPELVKVRFLKSFKALN